MRRAASCLFLSALALALLHLPARCAAPPTVAPQPEKWTIDDFVQVEYANAFRLSPDGDWAAYVKTTADKEANEHVAQVFRVDLRTGRSVQMTRSEEGCSEPQWSPDGKHLAFISARPVLKSKGEKQAAARRAGERRGISPRVRGRDRLRGGGDEEQKSQLWLIDPFGGEAWNVTDLDRAVEHYEWLSPDEILFTAQEEPTRRETRLEDEKDDTTVVEDDRHEPPVRLFKVDVKTKKVTRLTENADRITTFAASRDGAKVVALHEKTLRYQYDNRTKPVAYLHDLKEKKAPKAIFTDPKYNVQHFWWAPDGSGVYATDLHSSRPQLAQAGVVQLLYHSLTLGTTKAVPLNWPRGLAAEELNGGASCVIPTEEGFLTLLADGVRYRAARYTWGALRGWKREWLTGEHSSHLFGLASEGGKRVVYAHGTASQPPRWYVAKLQGTRLIEPVALTANEALANKARAQTEVVRWKGGLGEEVEGILYYPHGYKAGTKAPLVVMIHGGPASADLDVWDESWAYAPQLYCQRGAFVLRPNYHGSTNYGLRWVESIAGGNYLGPELDDIEKGVDALIGRGLVDPDRLALMGWSNGAILTNALTVRTTRYKAAVAGAGSVEYVSDWSSCEFGEAFDRFYFGRSPLEDTLFYQRKSPFYRLGRVRTPTLILFGADDRVVAPQQGWAHYRGLQQLGKAPVRFVQFPGEKHGPKKLSHQKRKLQEELAWMDRYLFKSESKSSEALKPDSPLARALKRNAAKKAGGHYGLLHEGVLVPETVKLEGLLVGRFEVTRAQYAAFDRGYRVAPGTENYPVSATYEQAVAYCAWLSGKTSQKYRLPSEVEAETLYDRGGEGENTLDRWAGYAVNPEDAVALREKARELGPGALLREVGLGKGTGEEPVFDLGGNVAEWVRGSSDKGVLRGGSADRPADSKGTKLEPGVEYRGFRVVRE